MQVSSFRFSIAQPSQKKKAKMRLFFSFYCGYSSSTGYRPPPSAAVIDVARSEPIRFQICIACRKRRVDCIQLLDRGPFLRKNMAFKMPGFLQIFHIKEAHIRQDKSRECSLQWELLQLNLYEWCKTWIVDGERTISLPLHQAIKEKLIINQSFYATMWPGNKFPGTR